MKRVTELLAGVAYWSTSDLGALCINRLVTDSRKLLPGDLFVAIAGSTVDGHAFIKEAVSRGGAAVVINRRQHQLITEVGLPVIEVDDSREALGLMAARYYDHPAQKMKMIGITGTNGKTTTTFLVESMVKAAGGKPGVIGTINYRYNGKVAEAGHTTPEAVQLQGLLAAMAADGVTHVIMEVSSHALSQKRVAGLRFDVALFTNLTHDHLDFHQSMEEYYQAKKRLFTHHLKADGTAVIIGEPPADHTATWGERLRGEVMAGRAGATSPKVLFCGLGLPAADLRPVAVKYGVNATTLQIQGPAEIIAITSRLAGDFNVKNVLGAVGIGTALAFEPGPIAAGIAALDCVPGRLERVTAPAAKQNFSVFVDYAHTPDALANVLGSLRQLCRNRLLVVFGCGGDRDHGKRAIMGEIAARLADLAIITADNSRSEAVADIAAAIEQGLKAQGVPRLDLAGGQGGQRGYAVILSRSEAIAQAIKNARAGDVVAICGKGHENYQLTREGKIFFDDRQQAREQLSQLP